MKRVVFFLMFLSLGIMGAKAQKYHYDVNNDGNVNITDAIFVVNKILGNRNPGDLGRGEAVSLGLPSGTLWATYNVGATKPEQAGDHYAFGETEVKRYFDWNNYIHCDGTERTCHNLGDISGTRYDVAHVKWGGNWRIPTNKEWEELVKFCTFEWTTYQGVQGAKLTSVFNDNSIFIPAAGTYWEDEITDVGGGGYYHSSTQLSNNLSQAYATWFYSDDIFSGMYGSLAYGRNVRPVVGIDQTNHYDVNDDGTVNITDAIFVVNKILGNKNPGEDYVGEAIDLGLPSGTMWSSSNLGAAKPEQAGEYYAWGETIVKKNYSEVSYLYYQNGRFVSIGTDISGTEYDVVRQKMGGKWCMPTAEDFEELLAYCNSVWTTVNGVNGRKFTSRRNGKSIFLPAAGVYVGRTLSDYGYCGFYWSSTHHSGYTNGIRDLNFDSDKAIEEVDVCCYGQSIRPVVKRN